MKDEWIFCKDQMPPIDKPVLVSDDYCVCICLLTSISNFNGNKIYKWEDDYGYWFDVDTYKAWMPLPKPCNEI